MLSKFQGAPRSPQSSLPRKVIEQDGVFIDSALKLQGVTAQFLENAEVYHQRYFQNDYWTFLINRAFDFWGDFSLPVHILDIGSGSGNTVLPLARRFPNATIIASDISTPLLRILVKVAEKEPDISGRLKAYCFDLHTDFFPPATFDLVVGGAILHHMLDPKAALMNAAKWLKPGGRIILFEPMEPGAHIVCAALHLLLDDDRLPDELAKLFRSLLGDYVSRFGVPNQKPWTKDLDDKWFFNTPYLKQLAKDLGLHSISVVPPAVEPEPVVERAIASAIRLSGVNAEIPARTLAKIKQFDDSMSPELKRLLATEAIVVMNKR